MSDGYGQIDAELDSLQGMTPEQRAALIRGEHAPMRLREFERSRGGEEDMLRDQIDNAYRLANSPISVHTNSQGAAAAGIIANALRTFGGYALAGQKEKQFKEAQAESDRKHKEVLGAYEASTGAGLDVKQQGLQSARDRARALRQFSEAPEGPWSQDFIEGLAR